MRTFWTNLLKGDTGIWMVIVILMFISVVTVFTSTSNMAFSAELRTGDFYGPFLRHVLFVLGAFIICVIGARVNPGLFSRLSYILIFVSVVLLLLVQLMGSEINQGSRWLSLFGIQFQPSEVARFSLINYVAFKLGSKRHRERATFWQVVTVSSIILGLIIIDNISTAMLLGAVIWLMCFLGGIYRKGFWIATLILMATAALGVAILLMLPDNSTVLRQGRLGTAKGRIERFVHAKKNSDDIEDLDADGGDYQVIHSKTAIARSRGIGVGPGNSMGRYTLPQPFSDFIFAIIVEEYGLFGCFLVLSMYVVLYFRIGRLATHTRSVYLKLLMMGIGLVIILQALINMLVAVGVFPVTGQTLPFISRGGTSYIITAIYFAVILSVSNRIEQETLKREAALSGSPPSETLTLEAIPDVDEDIYQDE